MFKTPILLVLYNRVEDTHNLFQIIRKIKPEKLYVAADGANRAIPLDYQLCLKTRSVIMPEWKCETKFLFHDEHIGKSKNVHQAISWMFEHEEEGIVLFDDTMPNLDFFHYCEQLLEKYRDVPEVMHIGANYLRRKKKYLKDSYHYSAYSFIWGFATWRNTWQGFNLEMKKAPEEVFKVIDQYVSNPIEKLYCHRIYNTLRKHNLDYWEYQYNFHIWHNNGLCVSPNVNLVTNVGFKKRKRRIRKLMKETAPILPIQHPGTIERNKRADNYIFKKVYLRSLSRVFADWFNEVILRQEKKL
ncbi:MAG: nucleotide-diphospho-sugar transferase [Bacteroidetes bacterium]|nr:nucleotide-diphospho-sugar transferase [Bacteroidota bacterium]MCL2302210.1 hypothetical protein [Lentimicrobiaceae bacterium]MCL2302290.1 hypothetical protein [Lentimicrobiaceae bacterium]